MPDDDRVLVNSQLVLHEGQPDGAKNRNYYYHCSCPSVSNLRAVMGSGMFSRRQVNPGISFSRLAAQPYLSIMELDSHFFSSKYKSQKHQFSISYQLDRRTSPEPLPGTITALLTGLIIKQKLYSLICVALYY